MAQITSNATGATVTLSGEDFIAGLSLNGTFGNTNLFPAMSKVGASNLQNINPFITYGVLSPGHTATNVTNNNQLAGVVVAGVVQGGAEAYLVDAGGRFQQYHYTSQTLSTTSPFPYTITGTTPVGQDVIVYKHNVSNTPTFGVFFSYYNTANWNVGVSNDPYSSVIDPYMSVTPANPLGTGVGTVTTNGTVNLVGIGTTFTSTFSVGDFITVSGETVRTIASITDDTHLIVTVAFSTSSGSHTYTYVSNVQRTSPHPMEIGTDDVLYIGSGRYVHAYDGANGANGTFSYAVLTLPLGFTVVALKKYQDVMLVAGNYNTDTTNSIGGEALLYQWNYIDQDITQAVDLEDPTVVSLFLWKGIPHVMTVGEKEGRGINKLKAIVGNNVTLRTTFNLTSPVNRGVDASSNVLYVNCGGTIVQIGDPYNINSTLLPVNQICRNTFAATNISGWVKNLGVAPGGTDYGLIGASSSVSSGGTNALSTFNTNWDNGGIYLTPFYEVPAPAGKGARLTNVILEYYSTFTGGDFTAQMLFDYGSTGFKPLFTSQASITAPLTKQYKYDSSGLPLQRCTNFAMEFIWNSNALTTATPPRITKAVFVFEYLDLLANNPA